MTLLQELGKSVVAFRRERGFSRAGLAKRSGLSARFLAELEAGRGNIALSRLARLCGALEISLTALMAALPSASNGKSKASRTFSSILSILSSCNEKQLEEAHLLLSRRFDSRRSRMALIGLRGAGKTTIGKKVAARLRWRFVELDEVVEKTAGLTLQNIFEVHGEEYYRKLEYDALVHQLSEGKPAVIATGGGIVMREQTYSMLRDHCLSFWLKARPEDHWSRVLEQDPRPIRNYPNAFTQLQNLLRARESLYAKADFTIDTSLLKPDQSVQKIVKEVHRIGEK